MDYTTSDGFETHVATGNRMHQDTAAVPTVLSAKDINGLTWSLMEIVKAAGLTPQQFDPSNADTYTVLIKALKKVLLARDGDLLLTSSFKTTGRWTVGDLALGDADVLLSRVAGAVSVLIGGAPRFQVAAADGPTRPDDAVTANGLVRRSQVESLVDAIIPIGFPAMWPASSPPTGWIKRNGALLPRSMYPRLTAAIQSGYLNVVSEAAWPNSPGAFTLGDGATTIRVPDARGLVDKGHHDGSSAFTTNTTRLLSSIEWDDVKSHNHGILMYGQETGSGRVTEGGPPDGGVKYTENTGGPENLIRNASYLPILRAA